MLPAPSVGRRALVFAALGLAFATSLASAEVTRIDIQRRADILGGRSFGTAVRTKSWSARPTSPSTRPTHATA